MKFSQAPSTIAMVRPASFGFNPETESTNAFQATQHISENVSSEAVFEFDRMVDKLRAHDIDVLVIDDSKNPVKPDAVFPNNWISFHHDGTVILYPMLAPNRRLEKGNSLLELIQVKFQVTTVIDFTKYESDEHFLEGTGSIVFDYENKIAYACRSMRTNETIFNEVVLRLGFKPILFDAVDEKGLPIYHTNVIMCVGSKFSTICLDAIKSDEDQELLLESMAQTNHQVVAISYDQMKCFAGNMMEVKSNSDEPFVLMSETAFNSLLPGQIDAISKHLDILTFAIPTIERIGGGSVRCMVAGVFNQKL